MRAHLKLLLIVLLISSPTWAATKYVDNSGAPACSDVPGNGSQANPWCTIGYAESQISGSDTVEVKNGTYAESFTINGVDGSSGSPTIFKAFSGHSPIIGTLGDTGRVKILNSAWIDFDGFEITDFNQGIFIEGSSNINFTNNTVHNVGQEGVRIKANSSFVLIEGNTVFNTGTNAFNGECYYVGTGSGGPLDNTNNVTIRNNIGHDCDDEGVELKPGTHDCIVEGNTLFNVVTGSASIGSIEVNERDLGAQSWTGNPSHIIRNNIIHTSNTAIRLGTGSTAYNNLIYTLTASNKGIRFDNNNSDSFTRIAYHNTIVLSTADALDEVGGTTDIQNNIGPTTAGNNIASNSAFYFDVANDNYHLVVASGPIDIGADLTSTVPTDLDGKTRPAVTPDAGAYEVVDDWYAASCSSANVQAAVDASSDGEQVLIPPGTCTYTTSIGVSIVNKGIRITGSGMGVTTIVNGIAAGRNFQANLEAGDPTFELTAITFDGNGLSTVAQPLISMNSGGIDAFRIHHINFIDMNGTNLSVNQSGLEVTGLVDHVTFQVNLGAGHKAIRMFGTNGADGAPFSRPLELGSSKFIFFEDSTWNYSAAEDGALDAFTGARFVFRYNQVNNTDQSHHGADSGGFRGIHSFENYNNTYDKDGGVPSSRAQFSRSGTGMIYNNTWTGAYSEMSVSNFRSRPQDFAPWGACDGTSVWDENQSGEAGYACLDQVGHIFGEFSGGSNTLEGSYYWSNTLDGVPMTTVTVAEGDPEIDNHLKDDREFYVWDTAFDGTSGIGVGTIASRPATCTVQVGYWATDEGANGKFYRCLTTDTWTFYYEPFTYPHPLQGEAAGDPIPVLSGTVTLSGDVTVTVQ